MVICRCDDFCFCLLDTQGFNQNRFSFISLLEKLGRFESTKGNSTRHSVSWKVLLFVFCHDQYLYGELNKRKAHLKQWREKAFVWSWKPTSHPPVESDSEFAFVPSVFFLIEKEKKNFKWRLRNDDTPTWTLKLFQFIWWNVREREASIRCWTNGMVYTVN